MRFTDTIGISHILKTVERELCHEIGLAIAGLDLTLPQYVALSCLEEKAQATNAELARKSGVTPQTMNKILQNLERAGFVSKSPSPDHGLKVDFILKPKATRALCKAHERVNEIEVRMLRGLSKKTVRDLESLLDQCLRNLKKTGIR